MSITDLIRIFTMFGGGVVVGGGAPVLIARARFYRAMGNDHGVRAMWALMAVNTLALAFACAVLIDRWSERLSWRTAVVIVMFVSKGYFFEQLRAAGIQQEAEYYREHGSTIST